MTEYHAHLKLLVRRAGGTRCAPGIAGLYQMFNLRNHFLTVTTMMDVATESLSASTDVAPYVPLELSTLHFPFLLLRSLNFYLPASGEGTLVLSFSHRLIPHSSNLCLAVIRAWGFEYLGYGHKVLLQAIDDLHALPTENHRAKIVPVVQSSGTGKSKTVDKIATERILFPLCIREHVGMNFFGAQC